MSETISGHVDAAVQSRYTAARKAALASFFGTAIEWYDFFLYGMAAALVFGPQFFPATDPVVSQIGALSTFAVGFLARPFGGIIAGHFGDRFGRKMLMIISLLVIGFGTILIGCLPTYKQVGIAAPVLLVILRIIQGLAVGAQWGGAAVLSVEHAPPNRRGLYGAAVQLGVPSGALLATLALWASSSATSREAFVAWGWRLGFLASIVLVVFALVIRRTVTESPLFEEAAKRAPARIPLVDVLSKHPLAVLRCIFATAASTAIGYIILVYILSYGTREIHYAAPKLLMVVTVTSAVQFVVMYLWSVLSDHVSKRAIVIGGAIGQIVVGLAFFPMFNTGILPLAMLACILGVTVNSAQYAPLPSLMSDQFPIRVRYTGVSLGYQLGNVVGGGFAPVVAVALFAATRSSMAIGYYLAIMAVLTIVSIVFTPKATAEDLRS